MTLNISNVQVEVKKIADFLSQMDSGTNDNGKYETLIQSSPEKQAWIEENFKINKSPLPSGKIHLDVNLDEAFKIIEA